MDFLPTRLPAIPAFFSAEPRCKQLERASQEAYPIHVYSEGNPTDFNRVCSQLSVHRGAALFEQEGIEINPIAFAGTYSWVNMHRIGLSICLANLAFLRTACEFGVDEKFINRLRNCQSPSHSIYSGVPPPLNPPQGTDIHSSLETPGSFRQAPSLFSSPRHNCLSGKRFREISEYLFESISKTKYFLPVLYIRERGFSAWMKRESTKLRTCLNF